MELNNFAITNQQVNNAESPSQWKAVQKLLCSKEYDLKKQLDHWQYEDLRSPALPFMAYKKEEFKDKILLAKEYKKSPNFKASGGYYLDYAAYEQRAKKISKEGNSKKGKQHQNRTVRSSPRSSMNSSKKPTKKKVKNS
jgi:hypothetical protein